MSEDMVPRDVAQSWKAKAENLSLAYKAQAAEIEKLREALEYYADRNNQCPNEGPWGVDSTDFGLVALKALKALRETK